MFTVCHTDYGYITHSYILADNYDHALKVAKTRFKNIRSVMKM